MKERIVDAGRPPVRAEVRAHLLTLSPRGPWFYAILIVVQAGAVALAAWAVGLPFGLTLATLFAAEGIACMVVAWFMSGREGDIGRGALAQIQRAQIAGVPDLPHTIPEARSDAEMAARNTPRIFLLVAYAATLMVLALLLAL